MIVIKVEFLGSKINREKYKSINKYIIVKTEINKIILKQKYKIEFSLLNRMQIL
jgi:hypothetical protein